MKTALSWIAVAAVVASISSCASTMNGQFPTRVNGEIGTSSTPNATIFVGAGDIAYESEGAEQTAKLLDKIPGIVFTLGDNAYQNGSPEEYQKYFHPTWGRHKARTLPVVGNHEYRTPNAAGYFSYFGEKAGDPKKGYYAFDLSPHWRVYALNSSEEGRDDAAKAKMAPDSEQYRWLSADLDANKAKNTIVMWHHPTFSSGAHGDNDETLPIWKLAQAKGVDIALWGHDHHYERFHPANGEGKRDDQNGIRAFLVGTGGKNHYPFFKLPKRITAERNSKTFGVLKLTLEPQGYQWEFVPVANEKFTDSGRSPVH